VDALVALSSVLGLPIQELIDLRNGGPTPPKAQPDEDDDEEDTAPPSSPRRKVDPDSGADAAGVA
jgi:hypothetical protein